MKGMLLFGTFLVVFTLAEAQVWNDQSNGVTIKTLFVPLRKGSTSIPIPDFSKIPPLTTLNLPSLSLGADLQQASALSQSIRSKGNLIELNLQPLQDVRTKHVSQSFKSEIPSQGSNYPNFYQNGNFPQQQYNNGPYHAVENVPNNHASAQHQVYQPESNYRGGHHQNSVYQRNSTEFHHQSNGMSNENYVNQDNHHNFPTGRVPNYYNTMSTGQVYTGESVVNHKIPTSDVAYTHSHNPEHQVRVYDRENSANQEIVSHQNTESNFSGQPSRYFHQMASDATVKQQPYMGSPNESYLPSPHQMNYGSHQMNNQHLDSVIHSPSPFQGFHSQENRHNPVNHQLQQQPVNTYAVVHQRIPTSNGQGNRGNEQSHFGQYKQVAEARPLTETRHSSHSPYASSEPAEYIKISSNQEHIPMQMASQNHLKTENPQNSMDMQYPMKQYASGNVNSYQYNSNPQVPHVQIMIPRNPHSSSERQYFQQQSSSPETEIRNQDVKSIQPQSSTTQGPYPDPTTETFYPENRQIYISPPHDYSSQQQKFHQQHPVNGQEYARFTSAIEAAAQSGQIPLSIQTGQVGIHLTIPNKSHANRDSPNYGNV